MRPGRPAPVSVPSPQAAAKAAGERLSTGTRVRHARFGDGVVLFTSGEGDKMKAKVKFDNGRAVMLMVSVTPMEIIRKAGR